MIKWARCMYVCMHVCMYVYTCLDYVAGLLGGCEQPCVTRTSSLPRSSSTHSTAQSNSSPQSVQSSVKSARIPPRGLHYPFFCVSR